MLMTKCCVKKTTKKRPESAITTLRAIEDFVNPLISAGFTNQIYGTEELLTNFQLFKASNLESI